MLNIPSAAVPVVATETRTILAATDRALLANANLFAAVIESVEGSNVPMHITQDIYNRIHAHGGKLVEGRDELRDLVTKLTAVKNRSDQREVALGCPVGAPEPATFFTDASLSTAEQSA